MKAAVEQWVEAPLMRFVDDARVLLSLLLATDGRVLAQHGFTRSVDVMSACALAAGIYAAASEMGRRLDGAPFGTLHHGGHDRQLFLAPAETKRGRLLLVAVFDEHTSLGLVRLYFEELRVTLAAATPEEPPAEPTLATDFEQELDSNLAQLFGRI